MIPSKELLSEVLNDKKILLSKNDLLIGDNVLLFDNQGHYLVNTNIYELAHQCKEWAIDKGYTITSGNNHLVLKSCSIRRTMTDDDWTDFYSDTEPEAIFKACEWIMEQTK